MVRRLFAALLIITAAAPSLHGQVPRTTRLTSDAPRLLVAPFERDARDSALSLQIADALRHRLRDRHLERFNTVSRDAMNTTLRESDYVVDMPLGRMEVRQLAGHLNARYLIEGRLVRRGGDSVLVIARLTERAGANPQSVNVAIVEDAARVAAEAGAVLANRLATGFQSFADVEECRRLLGQRDYARALRKAEDALRDTETNPAAHLCIADVVQALGASVDSVTAILGRAHEADTLNVVAMRRLAARYEAAGDTANLVVMLQRLLAPEPRDVRLRVSTVQLLVRAGRLPDAITLINDGLRIHPSSADLLTLRMIAHGATEQWDSAAAVGEIVAGMDGGRIDSLFVTRMIGYYRQAADTSGWLRWLDTGVRVTPSLAARARFVHASVHSARGDIDSALADARAAIALDSSLAPALASVYVRAGQRALRDSAWAPAGDHFAQARALASGGTAVLAAFFEGVSRLQQGRVADAEAESGRSCDHARQAAAIWEQAERALIAGAAQDRARASEYLGYVAQFKERSAGMLRVYCR